MDTTKRMLAVFAVVASAALCAFADVDPYADYVRLTASDPSANYSWNVAGNWDDNGAAPSSDKSYYVPAGMTLFYSADGTTPSIDQFSVWNGGPLVIAGKFTINSQGGDKYGPFVDDLTLLGGSVVRLTSYGPFYARNGDYTDVTVASTADNPAIIYHLHKGGSDRSFSMSARFTGTADSALVYYRGTTNDTGGAIDRRWVCTAANLTFANYPGQFTIRGEHAIFRASGSNVAYNWPDTALRIEDGAECKIFTGTDKKSSNANAYFRSYEVKTEGSVIFHYASSAMMPVINVTEGFDVDDTAKITIDNFSPNIGHINGRTADKPGKVTNMKVAHLSGTAAGAVGDLPVITNLVFSSDLHKIPDLRYKLEAFDNGDGTKDVWLATPDVVTMNTKNGDYSAFAEGYGSYWSNGETPPADSSLHYWAKKRLLVLNSVSFPNATLTLQDELYWKGGANVRFKEVNLISGCLAILWTSNRTRRLTAERLGLFANGGNPNAERVNIGVKGDMNLTVDADLYGECGFVIRNDNNGVGSISLSHVNTNFHGRLYVCQAPYSGGGTTRNNFTTYLGDARNWGGEFTVSENIYDAISVTNFPKVVVTNSVNFTEPTRGMLILAGAVFEVRAGKTMKLSNQVTYSGILEKTGAGTLDLAGTARFIDGAEETAPVADTNVIRVAEGALRISSATAADGLSLVFEEGTKLVIPAGLAGGYRNTKWDEPFTANTASGKLPVQIEIDAADLEDGDVEVTLCTFNATAAANVSASDFAVGGMSGGVRAKRIEKRAVEGGVAFVATVGRVGARFMVR